MTELRNISEIVSMSEDIYWQLLCGALKDEMLYF